MSVCEWISKNKPNGLYVGAILGGAIIGSIVSRTARGPDYYEALGSSALFGLVLAYALDRLFAPLFKPLVLTPRSKDDVDWRSILSAAANDCEALAIHHDGRARYFLVAGLLVAGSGVAFFIWALLAVTGHVHVLELMNVKHSLADEILTFARTAAGFVFIEVIAGFLLSLSRGNDTQASNWHAHREVFDRLLAAPGFIAELCQKLNTQSVSEDFILSFLAPRSARVAARKNDNPTTEALRVLAAAASATAKEADKVAKETE